MVKLLNIELHDNLVFILLDNKFIYFKGSSLNLSYNKSHICVFDEKTMCFYISHLHKLEEECKLPNFEETLETAFLRCYIHKNYSLHEKWVTE